MSGCGKLGGVTDVEENPCCDHDPDAWHRGQGPRQEGEHHQLFSTGPAGSARWSRTCRNDAVNPGRTCSAAAAPATTTVCCANAAVIASAKSVAPRGEALVMTLSSLLFDALAIPRGPPSCSIIARPCLVVSRGPMTRFFSSVAAAQRVRYRPRGICDDERVPRVGLRAAPVEIRSATHGKAGQAGQVGNFDAHRARHCDR